MGFKRIQCYIYNLGTHSYEITDTIMKIDIIAGEIHQKGLRIEFRGITRSGSMRVNKASRELQTGKELDNTGL